MSLVRLFPCHHGPSGYYEVVGSIKKQLERQLHGKASPFLFVGAGISRRYGGTPGWEGLLETYASKTSKEYGYYRTTADGDLPAVATAIATEFHELWWTSEEYAISRSQWGNSIAKTDSPLKVEISRQLENATNRLPESGLIRKEIDLLRNAVVDGIITTNYDTILETLFPTYKSFVGQEELLFQVSQGVGEIYKIHGCCTDPDSLVLTTEDYERFDKNNPYLAAKLLTIFVEHPIIFLGYSLEDSNVTGILNSIVGALSSEKVQELENRLIFIQWDESAKPTIGSHTIQTDSGAILPVHRLVVPNFVEVFEVLTTLRRSFSAKQLRQLKEQVYELVLTDDPEKQLLVVDIEDSTQASDIEVVFGVGITSEYGEVGYSGGIDRWDLIDDLVYDRESYQAKPIVLKSLPNILKSSGNVPVFRYLSQAGFLANDGSIKESVELPKIILERIEYNRGRIPISAEYTRKSTEVLKGIGSLGELERKMGRKGVFNYAVYMEPQSVDLDELRSFLVEARTDLDKWEKVQFAKLVCFLDWLKYGTGNRAF